MLATAGDLPTGGDWAYEFKWDGIRALCWLSPAGVRLLSRNGREVTGAYPELAGLAAELGARRIVLDGEVVACDPSGRPSFSRLQQRMHVRAPSAALVEAVPVIYHVFDVVQLDGAATTDLPYRRRRALLAELEIGGDAVRTPPHFVDVDGAHLLTAAEAYGLEGVVAKRLDSTYQPGRRSRDWIKVPITPTQEVVVIGWRPGDGRRAGTLGSLLLAVRGADGVLAYAGGVGTGFTERSLHDLQALLAPLARPDAPVAGVPREHARGAHWVHPVLVGEVAFRNWTPDGRLRHPSWRGLRPDKAPAQAVRVAVAPPTERVEGAMQTPDGRWRVEVVRRGNSRWYRIRHGDDLLDWLSIETVERLLAEAGVDRSTLAAVGEQPPAPARRMHSG